MTQYVVAVPYDKQPFDFSKALTHLKVQVVQQGRSGGHSSTSSPAIWRSLKRRCLTMSVLKKLFSSRIPNTYGYRIYEVVWPHSLKRLLYR